MPSIENYTEQVGVDLPKAVSLLLNKPEYLFKPQKDQVDILITRFPLGNNPISPEVAEVQQEWSNVGADTVPPNFSIQALERQYVFKDRDQVISFLENHPFLVSLLLEAYSKIETYFPEYPQVFLEVFTDPEVPDDTQLVASIKTNLSPDEALERLDSFDRKWWLLSMDRAKGELCIDVEFL
jgi:hypothetical protein